MEVTPCNLVLLGSEGVGKSTIVQQFLKKTFRLEYVPTTLETCVHFVNVDGNRYRLHFCDCSGSRGFSEHRAPYIMEAHGVMLVYSTTSSNSLVHLLGCANEVFSTRKQHGVKGKIPFILVGTRADIVGRRVVTMNDADRVAEGCLQTLGLKIFKEKKRIGYKGEGINGGMEVGPINDLPVLEISGANTHEVSQVVHTMIRMVCYFRATSRLPRLSLIYPGVVPCRNIAREVNLDAHSDSASRITSPDGRFTPALSDDSQASSNHYAFHMSPVGSDEWSASYSPRSVGVTQSVRSSGMEEDRVIVHPYLQQVDDHEIVFSPPSRLSFDASVNVSASSKTQLSSFAVYGPSERRALKVGPTDGQCPRCHLM
ncbi:small GTP-binding protein RAB6, putative [Trypanosoma cruzi marinkellei]|uniref:Small GTP-binding protein RAB6, putative n=1 Tax=Trypanosoma cruzi marinkellei TaxID=85056 RepID=K2MZD4_TRYCR|nr:small GTP-binding protein RAB6, putative [Trypanosoma cruzi marinkellei]